MKRQEVGRYLGIVVLFVYIYYFSKPLTRSTLRVERPPHPETQSQTERFWIATTNPQPIFMHDDEDTRNQVEFQRRVRSETLIRWLFRKIGNEGCNDDGPLVVDVGANEGFYTLLAASYGCRVISFEPQRLCVDRLSASFGQNNFKYQPLLFQNVVSDDPDFKVQVRMDECGGSTEYRSGEGGKEGRMELVESVSLDGILYAQLLLRKC